MEIEDRVVESRGQGNELVEIFVAELGGDDGGRLEGEEMGGGFYEHDFGDFHEYAAVVFGVCLYELCRHIKQSPTVPRMTDPKRKSQIEHLIMRGKPMHMHISPILAHQYHNFLQKLSYTLLKIGYNGRMGWILWVGEIVDGVDGVCGAVDERLEAVEGWGQEGAVEGEQELGYTAEDEGEEGQLVVIFHFGQTKEYNTLIQLLDLILANASHNLPLQFPQLFLSNARMPEHNGRILLRQLF